jgi:hypothetical protein
VTAREAGQPADFPISLDLPGLPCPSTDADRAADQWAALAWAVAGGGRAAGRVRVSRDGGRTYPLSRERDLGGHVPDQPAAVLLYDATGRARCLAADLDVGRGGPQQVDQDLTRLTELIERCAGRCFTDRSPSGGRHLYLPLAEPIDFVEMRAVLRALSVLLPSLDIAPAVNLHGGCLRPPGARHKSGGWQRLDGLLSAAQAIADCPNPPAVWAALVAALRPQLDANRPIPADPSLQLPPQAAGGTGAKQRGAHQLAAARPGGRRPLRSAVLSIAECGAYDPATYPTPSQARQAVHAAAAASGWTYPDIVTELETGNWPGLWSFYGRYADRHRREALAGDWIAAHSYAKQLTPQDSPDPAARKPPAPIGMGHVHRSATSPLRTQRGVETNSHTATTTSICREAPERSADLDGHAWLLTWRTAVQLGEAERYPGPVGHVRRLLLRALGNAAIRSGRRHVRCGTRSYAIAIGRARSTVGSALRELSDEPDPYLTLLVAGRGLAADLYELRIPDTYSERASATPWRPGRIEALLPVFRVLGTPAGFVYELLDSGPQSSWTLAAAALLGRSTTCAALSELAANGLAIKSPAGWTRGSADPATAAHTLGADQLVTDQVEAYRADRRSWRTRLGLDLGPGVDELLDVAPPPPPDPQMPDEHTDWAPTYPQPPPETTETALELVCRVLGGVLIG